ncbi:MAG: cobalamin biosynthesis protein [Lachnospiraceae bacterium]
MASIDLKQEEEGILAFCREKQIPFMTYSAKQLQIQMGSFTASDFVEKAHRCGIMSVNAA